MLVQLLINGMVRASELAMLGIGLTLTFGILKFANFAHTSFAVIGAYIAFVVVSSLGSNLVIGMVIGAFLVGLFAIGLDWLTFKRLRDESDVTLMIVSMGLSIAIRNSIRFIWGTEIRSYVELSKSYQILGAWITRSQLWLIIIAVVSMIGFHFLIKKSILGKAMRATSENRGLAQASGISTEQVIRWTWFIGGFFAGLGGVLVGWETQIYPYMGFDIIIPVYCVVILGGLGNPYGAMLGAVFLGFAENFGVFIDFSPIINIGGLVNLVNQPIYIPVEYKVAISFFVLVLVLLLRPSGILGKR